MLELAWMFMDSTNQCAQYKLKIVYKTWQQKQSVKHVFFLNKVIFWFPCCSTREDLSIDVSITNVGQISTKLVWFQHLKHKLKFNFDLFWKENEIFGFPCCSTRSFHWCINYYCRTDIDEVRVIYIYRSSYGQTDTVLESSYGNMSAHKKLQLKIRNYLSIARYMPPLMTGVQNNRMLNITRLVSGNIF